MRLKLRLAMAAAAGHIRSLLVGAEIDCGYDEACDRAADREAAWNPEFNQAHRDRSEIIKNWGSDPDQEDGVGVDDPHITDPAEAERQRELTARESIVAKNRPVDNSGDAPTRTPKGAQVKGF